MTDPYMDLPVSSDFRAIYPYPSIMETFRLCREAQDVLRNSEEPDLSRNRGPALYDPNATSVASMHGDLVFMESSPTPVVQRILSSPETLPLRDVFPDTVLIPTPEGDGSFTARPRTFPPPRRTHLFDTFIRGVAHPPPRTGAARGAVYNNIQPRPPRVGGPGVVDAGDVVYTPPADAPVRFQDVILSEDPAVRRNVARTTPEHNYWHPPPPGTQALYSPDGIFLGRVRMFAPQSLHSITGTPRAGSAIDGAADLPLAPHVSFSGPASRPRNLTGTPGASLIMEGGDPREHDAFWARQFGYFHSEHVGFQTDQTVQTIRVTPPYTPLSRASRDHGSCWMSDHRYVPKLTTREVLLYPKECSICFESVPAREEVYSLKCTHRFHDACLKPWAEHNTTCPSCRRNLS